MRAPGTPTSPPPAVADRLDVLPSAKDAHRLVADPPPSGWTEAAVLDVVAAWTLDYLDANGPSGALAFSHASRAAFDALGLPGTPATRRDRTIAFLRFSRAQRGAD